MKKDLLFLGGVIAILLAVPVLNGFGPILGSRQELSHFHLGPIHVRIGYIK